MLLQALNTFLRPRKKRLYALERAGTLRLRSRERNEQQQRAQHCHATPAQGASTESVRPEGEEGVVLEVRGAQTVIACGRSTPRSAWRGPSSARILSVLKGCARMTGLVIATPTSRGRGSTRIVMHAMAIARYPNDVPKCRSTAPWRGFAAAQCAAKHLHGCGVRLLFVALLFRTRVHFRPSMRAFVPNCTEMSQIERSFLALLNIQRGPTRF